jgi:cobalt/nickel transport system permease protein
MTLAFRDPSVPDSPVARWDARWKLAALLVAAAGTAATRHAPAAAAALLAGLLLTRLARVPPTVVASRLGLLLLGVAPFLLLAPFTDQSLAPAAALGLRVLAVGAFALTLVRSGPPARTFAAAHELRVPGPAVQVAQLAHRYTFLIAAEVRRMRVALRARGFRPRTTAHTYRTLGHGVGALLVRSGERADRVAAAMRCRGYDGTARPLAAFHTTFADRLSFAAVAAGTITLVLADRLLF